MMRRRKFLADGASLAAAGLFANRAYSLGGSSADSASPRIEALAEAARKQLKVPGLAYGVVRSGGEPLKGGLGVKELGKPAPITSQTLFHMASVTKPFVATVLAQRVEQGRLRLNQRLYDVLPEFRLKDPRASSITIEYLLTHTSGLVNTRRDGMTDLQAFAWDRPETDEGALKRYLAGLSHIDLLSEPGERFAYTDVGFEVLARVIEVLDGVPFETAVRQTIFTPLKMNTTTLFYPEADKTQVASPHLFDEKGEAYVSAVFPYNRRHAGSSTLLSCVDDMVRWVQFNLNGGVLDGVRILSPETVRSMRTPRPVYIKAGGPRPEGSKVALSWFLIPKGGRELFMHAGGDLGFLSLCLFCPQDGYGFVMMVNGESKLGSNPLSEFAFTAIDEGLVAS